MGIFRNMIISFLDVIIYFIIDTLCYRKSCKAWKN